MKKIFAGLFIRKSLFIGFILVLPLLVVLVGVNMLVDILGSRWDPVFDFFGISRFTEKTAGFAGVGVSFVTVYVIGRFMLSKRIRSGFVGKFLRSLPVIGFVYKMAVTVVATLEELESFPVVMIEQYDGNYAFGVAVGIQKHRRILGERTVQRRLLRVYYPDFPAQFNGRGNMVEFRRADRILNSFAECAPLFGTAYIAAPDWIISEPWSAKFNEELESIANGIVTNDKYVWKDIVVAFRKRVLEWRPSFLKKRDPKS